MPMRDRLEQHGVLDHLERGARGLRLVDQLRDRHRIGDHADRLVLLQRHVSRAGVLKGDRLRAVQGDRELGGRALGRADALAFQVGRAGGRVAGANGQHLLGNVIGVAEVDLVRPARACRRGWRWSRRPGPSAPPARAPRPRAASWWRRRRGAWPARGTCRRRSRPVPASSDRAPRRRHVGVRAAFQLLALHDVVPLVGPRGLRDGGGTEAGEGDVRDRYPDHGWSSSSS